MVSSVRTVSGWLEVLICVLNLTKAESYTKTLFAFNWPPRADPLISAIPLKLSDFGQYFTVISVVVTRPFAMRIVHSAQHLIAVACNEYCSIRSPRVGPLSPVDIFSALWKTLHCLLVDSLENQNLSE